MGEGAPIASQIADQLRGGGKFRNFKGFRKRFWKAVAADPILSQQFNQHNLIRMKKGLSAITHEREPRQYQRNDA
ncbi:hypothetical protein [Pseudomonas brassicacearum]|uniref:hypothetical protein n=1 Tax=Pseudomonas brassicacearum TaxID=930166 RepID=UPI0035C7325D